MPWSRALLCRVPCSVHCSAPCSVPFSTPWVRRHRVAITAAPGEPRLDVVQGFGMGEKPLVRIALASAVSLAVTAGFFFAPASAQSLSDRFKSLFGGKPDEPAQDAPAAPAGPTENQIEDSCPPVAIRAGASTFAVGPPGKQATGNDLRY